MTRGSSRRSCRSSDLVLRTRAGDVSLWEAVLPPQVLRLPEELARGDALLDDPGFFAPFVPFFRSGAADAGRGCEFVGGGAAAAGAAAAGGARAGRRAVG